MNAFTDYNGTPLSIGDIINYKGRVYTITSLNTRTMTARIISANRTKQISASILSIATKVTS